MKKGAAAMAVKDFAAFTWAATMAFGELVRNTRESERQFRRLEVVLKPLAEEMRRKRAALVEMSYRCLHDEPLPEVKPGMSNFNHCIDDGAAEAIADGAHMLNYAGWDFHAYVYRDGDVYVADVHRYRVHADFIEAKTLEDLMVQVSERWGYG